MYIFYILLLISQLALCEEGENIQFSNFKSTVLTEDNRATIGSIDILISVNSNVTLDDKIVYMKDIMYNYLHSSRSYNLMNDQCIDNLREYILHALQEKFGKEVVLYVQISPLNG